MSKNNELEKFINELPSSEVYLYMREEYRNETSDGETYDVEHHDDLIAKRAADKYSITAEEAGQIYADSEVAIANYQIENKDK